MADSCAGHSAHHSWIHHQLSTASFLSTIIMFISRASTIAIALFAVVATSTEAISLRRRLGATYSADSADWKQAMLTAVNEQRANNGLSALCLNSKLTSASQSHSDDMAANNYMDHDGADGSTMSSRITAAGYDWTYIEENVAAGQVDVDAVMESWMNSEGHRANILGSDVTMFGCGYAYSESTTYGHYWTQDFGAGSTEACDGSSSSSTTTASSQKSDDVAAEASTDADVYTPETTTPTTEAPTAAPATEAPATEAPATEAPATEAPATEAPATEAPATEAPATEAPTSAPETSAPSTESPTSGGCKVRRH